MSNDIYISSLNGVSDMGMMGGPAPRKKGMPSSSMADNNTLDGRLANMAKSGNNVSTRLQAFNDVVLGPMLADLTNQTGLLHSTKLYYNGEAYNRTAVSVSLFRKRPNNHTFLNWWARFFSSTQAVLDITHNGQLWCVTYHVSQYFMTAESIKELYYSKMRGTFGGQDMVIVNND